MSPGAESRTIRSLRSQGRRIDLSLDALNFFLADVRDGLGPFLAVYLLTTRHWDEESIGVVMSVMGIATMAAQVPVGAFIDRTHHKRATIIVASACVGVSAVVVTMLPSFLPVAASKAAMGVAAAVFAPAVAAVTRGLVPPWRFSMRIGRNEAFNHAGNATAAVLAGLVGTFVAPAAIFWLVSLTALISIAAALLIPAGAIDHDAARGLTAHDHDHANPSRLAVLLECRPLLVFAVCIGLFHLANAAMLPLVGQELAVGEGNGPLFMSACIIVAQLVMAPVGVLVGRRVDAWGRKPLFLAGFAVLPLRGILFTLSYDPAYLIAVQMLDGVGAGVFGALFPIVIADLTKGTGHYNLAQGATATVQGIGAALSTSLAGFVVIRAGYNAAFLTLALIALTAAATFLLAMPETKPGSATDPADETPRPKSAAV